MAPIPRRPRPWQHIAQIWASIVLAVLAALAALAAPVTAQQAAPTLSHAGLVVRHGDGSLTYAFVGFPEAEINGLALLERSGIDRLTVPFGGLGEGVCALEGEGCGASACRRTVCQTGGDGPFWQYFRQAAPGDWRPLALGASAARVRDGDLDAWSWTGDDPGLPALTLAEVARRAGVPDGEVPASPGEAGAPASVASGVPVPTAALRSGYQAPGEGGPQGPVTYAAAGLLLAAVVAVGVFATRRARGPSADGAGGASP